MRTILVKNSTKQRLDHYLALELAVSRAQIQKAVREKIILLNNAPTKPSIILHDEDIITISKEIAAEKNFYELPPPSVPILYEDNQLLAIDKPRGVLVHPAHSDTHSPTITAWLRKFYPNIQAVGEDPLRPGIVHRLDKETSGVLLVAKTPEMFSWLKKVFRDRLIQKKYLALVEGRFPARLTAVSLPIGRSPKRARQIALPENRAQKQNIKTRAAETEFSILKEFAHHTLMEARPHTGRTHQIRVHLASVGHPISGDKLYGHKIKDDLDHSILVLHASSLTIPLPDGSRRTITAPTPQDFQQELERIR